MYEDKCGLRACVCGCRVERTIETNKLNNRVIVADFANKMPPHHIGQRFSDGGGAAHLSAVLGLLLGY